MIRLSSDVRPSDTGVTGVWTTSSCGHGPTSSQAVRMGSAVTGFVTSLSTLSGLNGNKPVLAARMFFLVIALALAGLYPLTRRRPQRKRSVQNTRIRTTRIGCIDLINTNHQTMPSNCTSNDIDLVQPTQYNAQLNQVAKNPPPESWLLPDFTTASYF